MSTHRFSPARWALALVAAAGLALSTAAPVASGVPDNPDRCYFVSDVAEMNIDIDRSDIVFLWRTQRGSIRVDGDRCFDGVTGIGATVFNTDHINVIGGNGQQHLRVYLQYGWRAITFDVFLGDDHDHLALIGTAGANYMQLGSRELPFGVEVDDVAINNRFGNLKNSMLLIGVDSTALDLKQGNDVVSAAGVPSLAGSTPYNWPLDVRLGPGSDVIEGGVAGDHIWGGKGNDFVYGRGGDDVITTSDDYRQLDPFRDVVEGGAGEDTCFIDVADYNIPRCERVEISGPF